VSITFLEHLNLSAQPYRNTEEKNQCHRCRIFAGTWNVGSLAPPNDLELEDWLDTKANSYDIYVLG
jgi:hypothetical protein